MEHKIFKDFDFSDFWNDNACFLKEYVDAEPSDALIKSIEDELGYKLPASYIELMKLHNGGIPKKDAYPTTEEANWDEYGRISTIIGIGRNKDNSLCGKRGNQFWIDQWGYPNTGVYICDCPSAGHDMIMLDYTNCGRNGEPEVVHIDQELDYQKTYLAKNFEAFIRSLVNSDTFDIYENSEELDNTDEKDEKISTSEDGLLFMLEYIKKGRFSNVLEKYFKANTSLNFDRILRNLFTELATKKGYFSIEGDELSYLAFDIQFYLLTINKSIRTKESFIKEYIPMVAMGNNHISTHGYDAYFIEKWFDDRVHSKQIEKKLLFGFKCTQNFKKELFERIKTYA